MFIFLKSKSLDSKPRTETQISDIFFFIFIFEQPLRIFNQNRGPLHVINQIIIFLMMFNYPCKRESLLILYLNRFLFLHVNHFRVIWNGKKKKKKINCLVDMKNSDQGKKKGLMCCILFCTMIDLIYRFKVTS